MVGIAVHFEDFHFIKKRRSGGPLQGRVAEQQPTRQLVPKACGEPRLAA
jgi:hypothetical protein